ncbi:Ig-like domain-containing protein [Candidatus Desantisbacteria bacterium]|nr:Ig-like domain-containing protein [Candidatus Desantisbacteria bacterium]
MQGNITYNNKIAVCTPVNILEPSTTYTAVVTTGVKDLEGNAIRNNYAWTFTTEEVSDPILFDTTLPQVVSSIPVNGVNNTPLDTEIKIKFQR